MSTPTELPSARDVIGWLNELRADLDTATRRLAEADEALVMAKQTHELRRARTLIELGREGTVAERDALATVRCEGELFAEVIAQQQHRAAKERVRNLRDQLDAVRSLNSAVNTEWRTQAMGQPA